MDIRFIGTEGETADVCTAYGLTFSRNEWVVVPADADPFVIAKLSANPTFETRGEAPASAPGDDAPVRQPKAPRASKAPKAPRAPTETPEAPAPPETPVD